MKFLITTIFLFLLSVGQCQTALDVTDNQKLIGRWVSLDDKSYQIVFTNKTELQYYGTKLQSTYSYRIVKDSLIAKDKLNGALYSYSIMSITNTNLTLLYLARGNLLKFTKKPSYH